MSALPRELIAVRSLTVADLGVFKTQRSRIRSRQRAITINVWVARAMLSPRVFEEGGGPFRCVMRFGGEKLDEVRSLKLVGKNWRLCGDGISAPVVDLIDSKDFMILRTTERNDGACPLDIAFFSRNANEVLQIGISGLVQRSLRQSMVVYFKGEDRFEALAQHCPASPWVSPRMERGAAQADLRGMA